MAIRFCVAFFITLGLFLLFGINPFAPLKKLKDWRPKPKAKRQTAAAFIRELDGRKRDNIVRRSLNDTRNSLTIIGQENRYKRTVRISLVVGILGGAAGLLFFRSILLAVVLGLGCGLIPLWLTNLAVYRHNRSVNDELETALSIITTTYIRTNDIIIAVEDAIGNIDGSVKQVFQKFSYTTLHINSNVEAAILQMKKDLDNTLFHQWCDILLLCQSDHTLNAGLQPIVTKISELKRQQEENETQMMMPLRNILQMTALTLSVIPLLYFVNYDWFSYLAYSLQGQITLTLVFLVVFQSINKAIRLAKPLDYQL